MAREFCEVCGLTSPGQGVQEKISRGLARVAQMTGTPVQRIRPISAYDPLASGEVAEISCLIDSSTSFDETTPLGWGKKFLYASMDLSVVQVGDYLVRKVNSEECQTLFVSRVEEGRPALVVSVNNIISILESDNSSNDTQVGLRTPEGPVWKQDVLIASNWPVSMFLSGAGTQSPVRLGTDVGVGRFEMLAPHVVGFAFRQGLRVKDQLGQTYHIAAVEITEFGNRMIMTADQA